MQWVQDRVKNWELGTPSLRIWVFSEEAEDRLSLLSLLVRYYG